MSLVTPRRERPHYEGKPTLARVMVMPKWIGALVLALIVAGGFAWLGQWQLGHAITLENENSDAAADIRPLTEVTGPGESMTDASAGLAFTTSGVLSDDDYFVVEERSNGGAVGAWVVGHLITSDATPGHLAVAIGWAPTAAEARASVSALQRDLSGLDMQIEGRYMPAEAPVKPQPDEDLSRLSSMAPSQLVNLWQPFEGNAYAGYLVLHPDEVVSEAFLTGHGLDLIDSVPPLPVETINWLNLFYAIEWVVFAGFAVFFWYRLARDDWEKIHERQLLAATEVSPAEQ